MLSMNAFNEGIEAIENTYVNRRFHLGDPQTAQWYKMLKNTTDEAFLNAVDEWCSTKNTLPAPSDILDTCGRLRCVDNSVEIPKNKEHCKICNDEGVFSGRYFNKDMQTTYEYVCCCICEAGEYCHMIYALPQVDRNKLSMLQQVPKAEKEKVEPKIDRLVKQMSFTF
jgi:hypothetical protein